LKNVADYERFVGRTVEINDRRAEIVGVCDVSANFLTLTILYTTYTSALQIAPPQRKLLSFILVQAAPGVAPRELSERIATRTENSAKALTGNAFFWKTIYYYVTRTGLPINFGMTVALGFLVGTAVAGLTFYQFTIENLKQFGALKAMGTSNWRILGLTLFQAMVVAPIGYSLGIGLAALFGRLTQDDPTAAFYMPWEVLILTAVAVLVICVTSSMLSIRRVLVLEPAIVFRT
jgi:putative ABC transport system permease protein